MLARSRTGPPVRAPWGCRWIPLALALLPAGAIGGEPQPASSRMVLDAWQQQTGGDRQWRLAELPPATQALLTELLLEHLPHQYEDDREWGKTRRVIDGWDVEWDGLRIETRRRWKEVEHGTWWRYRLTLVDPARNARLRVHDLAELAPGTLGFRAELRCPIRARARMSRWRWGVQVWSVSAEADARVRIRLASQLSMRLDPVHLPPDLRLIAHLTDMDLEITDLKIHRISKLDGPLVDELGGALEEVLERRWDRQKEKTVARINRRLADEPDLLRFSLHDALLRPMGGTPAGQAPPPVASGPLLLPPQ